MEQVGRRWRVPCGTVLNYFTTLGSLVAGGLGYAIRDWVQLQLAVTAPLALLLAGFWSVPGLTEGTAGRLDGVPSWTEQGTQTE